MKRLLVLLVIGFATTAGIARGDGTFSIVPGPLTLPSAASPNGADLILAPTWTTPPAQPVQLFEAGKEGEEQ